MNGLWIFLAMTFTAVFLLAQGLVVPVFGEARRMRKRLQARLNTVAAAGAHEELVSLLREKYLRELSPLARSLESLPGMEWLARLIEQSGRAVPAYGVVLMALALAAAGAFGGWSMTRFWQVSALLGVVGFALPFLKITHDRARRIGRFEEQLPDALDIIKRALKAGHPFSQTLKLVVEDMDGPVRSEFEHVFSEISYGGDARRAMLGLLERIPCVSVMAFVTAVLIQKETGGNLAETLERISAVIRSRFKFYRRVRTLSAEGRLSAWILILVPFVLFAVISITTPDYLPMLLKDPRGPKLITAASVLAAVGIAWIRRLIRLEV